MPTTKAIGGATNNKIAEATAKILPLILKISRKFIESCALKLNLSRPS